MNTQQIQSYGQGPNGPGHCFHQHITYFLRQCAGQPPGLHHLNYAVDFFSFAPVVTGRLDVFEFAHQHFEAHLQKHHSWMQAGLVIEKIDTQDLKGLVESTRDKDQLVLAAVDTYHLPSFVEHQLVHGLTMVALLETSSQEADLWHWENTCKCPWPLLLQATQALQNRFWKLSLQPGAAPLPDFLEATQPFARHLLSPHDKPPLEQLWASLLDYFQEPRPALSAAEQKIHFHVPYRRFSNGSFSGVWLLRSISNRLMHTRGTMHEALVWLDQQGVHGVPAEVLHQTHQAHIKWKTLNMLCARYDLRPSNDLHPILQQCLQQAVESDVQLGETILLSQPIPK